MKIGMVIAMDKEFSRVVALMNDTTESVADGQRFVSGTVGKNTVVATQCGVGKVNAAMGTTRLIERFAPDMVVSTGVAGGTAFSLNVQDVVVSTQVCYHDVYCGNEYSYGQVMGTPPRFDCDEDLTAKALSQDYGTKVVGGLIVTGDWFVDSRDKMMSILAHFPDAVAVDMESAAIAHVCYRLGVKFVSFRIISDVPLKDTKAQQYFDFWQRIADNSFGVTRTFLQSL